MYKRFLFGAVFSFTLSTAAGPAIVTAAFAADATPNIITNPVPVIAGPKRTIAVGQIDALGPFATNSGSQVGGAVAAMLTTALEQSGRFTVVERDALSQIVGEQELAANKVAAGNLAPKPGTVIPAQYLVVGAVTEYSTNDSGSTANGSNNGVGLGGLGLGLSYGRNKGRVALDLRLVDTRTGSVAKSFSVKQELDSTNVGVTGGYSGITLGGSQFWNTPLGDATRRALNDAVIQIAQAVGGGKWQGQVVELDGGAIYVNAGAESGIRVGDHYRVERTGKVFTDPGTGQVLSARMLELGTITINNVEPKMSSGSFTAQGASTPARGDLVVATE